MSQLTLWPLSPEPRADVEYILVLRVANQEIRVVAIPKGVKPRTTRTFTRAGPFASEADASAALRRKDESVRRQLYPRR